MTNELMTDADVSKWFGRRAAGLLYSTTDRLAEFGLAPVCLTSSFAHVTGELRDRKGAVKPLPTLRSTRNLPRELLEKIEEFYYQQPGHDYVIPGELGGVSSDSRYRLVDLSQVNLHEQLVRVSCRGTKYVFTRHPGGWSMTRTEAV